MSKRKYKIMVDITLLLLCLFPLILILINSATSDTLLTVEQIQTIVGGVNINNELSVTVRDALASAQINLEGNFGACVAVVISNSIMVHIIYLFIEILCFIPKFAIKALNMFTGGDK